jgi:TonB-dependent starch-binding outer membrane protein SusC
MEEETIGLDEVVAIGYGTMKKSDLTGSVVSVQSGDLEKVTVTSLAHGLQGRAAGVQVTQTSARPGGPVSIRIRGGTSIQASNEPLYVIDGFPSGDLNNINPNDIQSVEILKDASATAIYGSRGANGVVLITTKRGVKGQNYVRYSGSISIGSAAKRLELMNAKQYAEYINDYMLNSGNDPKFSDQEIAQLGEGTNWQNEVMRNAIIQEHNLTFTGGTETTQYLVNVGYLNQEGIIIGSDFERYSLRANLDSSPKKWLKIGSNHSISHSITNSFREGTGAGPNAGPIDAALEYPPIESVFDEFGDYTHIGYVQAPNPVAFAMLNEQIGYDSKIVNNIFGEIKLPKGFSFRTSFGTDLLFSKNNFFSPNNIIPGESSGGIANIGAGLRINWNFINQLNYNFELGKHDISATLVSDIAKSRYEGIGASNSQFFTNTLGWAGIGTGTPESVPTPNASVNEWVIESYLSRLNYSFDNKFLITLSGRIDGSSRFAKNHKYAFFPSAALAYRLSQESFIENISSISNLKLRLSYGATGSQSISTYQSLNALASLGRPYTFDGKPAIGLVPSRLANPDLTWETTEQFNLGVDFGFFKDRINLVADAYIKNTKDLLLYLPIPMTSGYSSKLANAGSMQNKGVELALNTVNFEGSFRWTTAFNIGFNRNEVTDLGGLGEFFAGHVGVQIVHNQNVYKIKEGEPIGSIYGYVYDGIFQNQAELDAIQYAAGRIGGYRYKDLNDDGIINADDRTFIGRATPDFFGGFDNEISYKNFDLGIFFSYVYGNDIVSATKMNRMTFMPNETNQLLEGYEKYWRGEGTSSEVAAPGPQNSANSRLVSTHIVEDGSYLRLRSAQFGYTFSPKNSNWIENARIYLLGENLFILTKYKYGYDPEVNTQGLSNINLGVDSGGYPRPRTITFGVRLTF